VIGDPVSIALGGLLMLLVADDQCGRRPVLSAAARI
jgi:hypothetical protein